MTPDDNKHNAGRELHEWFDRWRGRVDTADLVAMLEGRADALRREEFRQVVAMRRAGQRKANGT